MSLSKKETKELKDRLVATMVSRVSLAEAVNIMHQLALKEVETNVEAMSDEEEEAALGELRKGMDKDPEDDSEKTEGKTEGKSEE